MNKILVNDIWNARNYQPFGILQPYSRQIRHLCIYLEMAGLKEMNVECWKNVECKYLLSIFVQEWAQDSKPG